ncbi:hypothetical protein VaNZ11_013697 [Volvox africanus]|uniref:Uncharacterized protein n=1 Tax=Volvox africanus TaxID=51714 RepID=A0ABQ5SHY5_9CHLO|nr:hypothetical protein VaNZ11_013697 [Volvox africanus]
MATTYEHISCKNMYRLLLYAALLLSSFSCNTIVTSEAKAVKPYDSSYDWESTVVAKGAGGCTFPKKPIYLSPATCPPTNKTIDRGNASQLGWRFAPILYQHPLDNSWLSDPQRWFNMAAVYDRVGWQRVANNSIRVPPGVRANRAEDEYLSAQEWFATRVTVPTYNKSTQQVSFDTVDGATMLQRAVVDPVVNGRLTGKVWFTVFRPYDNDTGETIPNAYVYTFMYWYPFNGCSNQLLATQVAGRKQGVEYFMCGDGAHEGDLEHVKVYVCEADMLNADPSSAIRAAQYSQHGWLPQLDCTSGECKFEVDESGTRRLVTLAGLYSHSNWIEETPLFVYRKIQFDFLLNMDGLYLGDRYKKGPVFYPNSTNTAFLPFRAEMSAEEKSGPLAWSNFPGVWGATLSFQGRTITCFRNNFTELAPCDIKNPAYYILDVLMKPKSWQQDQLDWTAVESGNTVTGPLWSRMFAYAWEVERGAPLYDNADQNHGSLSCPLEAPLKDTYSDSVGFGHISLKNYLGAVTGLVLTSAVVAFAMILPAMLVRGDRAVIKQVQEEEEARQATFIHGQEEPVGPRSPAHSKAAITEAPPVLSMGNACSGGEGTDSSGGAAGMGCRREAAPVPFPPQSLSVPTLSAPPIPMGLPSPPSPVLPASGSGVTSGNGNGNGNRSRLSLLLMSHEAILRAFHASVMQPWFLVAWIFIGIDLYIVGVVLAALGIRDSVKALQRVVPLSLWQILHQAIIAVFIVFGVLQGAIVVTSIWVRPTRNQLCNCGPKALKCSMECLNRSWAAHAVLVGLLVMEINVSMLLFALGLMLWIARFIMTEACIFAIKTVFNGVTFLEDTCVDLSSIGLPDRICGSMLTNICMIWGGLRVDLLSFGSMCFVIAQAMFLVLSTTNYVATRTGYAITTVMHLTQTTEEKRAARSSGGVAQVGSGNGNGSGRLIALLRGSANLRNRSKSGLEQAGGGDGAASPVPDGGKRRVAAADAGNKGMAASGNDTIGKSGEDASSPGGAAAGGGGGGEPSNITIDKGPDWV